MKTDRRVTGLRQYLEQRGWQTVASGSLGESWHHPELWSAEVAVPFDQVDDASWADIVERIAAVEDVETKDLRRQLDGWWTDAALLRAANGRNDSIPLEAGAVLVSSGWQMLRASATTARGPKAVIRGNYRTLGDITIGAARMGHTEPGSYVIPVLLPLSEVKEESTAESFDALSAATPETPERRVMRTFAQSLAAVESQIVRPAKEAGADQIQVLVTSGVSREFLTALHRVAVQPEVGLFTADFSWAGSATPPESLRKSLAVPAEAGPLLARTARKLKPAPKSKTEVFTGPIRGIFEEDENSRPSIQVETMRNSRPCRIRVVLDPGSRHSAVEWFESRETVVVTGVIRHTGSGLQVDAPDSVTTLASTLLTS